MILRKITKAILILLISITGLLLLLFISLNLPFTQRSITGKINIILSKAGLPIEIGSIKRILFSSLKAENLLILSSEGDTIVFAGELKAEFKPLALLKHKVTLPSVYLSNAIVNFSRDNESQPLNIAGAFSKDKTSVVASPGAKESVPWDVSFGKAELSGLKFMMNDSVAGIFINQDVRRITAETENMSIVTKTVIARSIDIEGLTGNITINSPENNKDTTSSLPWNFGLGELNASEINFTYDSPSGKLRFDILGEKISFKARKTDIKEKIIDFDLISLTNTDASLKIDKKPAESSQLKEDKKNESSELFNWKLKGDLINLQDLSFRTARYTEEEIDTVFQGLSILKLSMQLSDILLNKDEVNADLKTLNIDLGNGFSISKMSADINSKSNKTSFGIKVETERSKLEVDGMADAGILEILNDPSNVAESSIAVNKSTLSLKDFLILAPNLTGIPGIKTLAANPVFLDGKIRLNKNIITIPSFTISRSPGFDFSVEGQLANIFTPKIASIDLKFGIREIDNDLISELISELKPDLPKPVFTRLDIEGTLSDSLVSPGITLKIQSDLGDAEFTGALDSFNDRFSLSSTFRNLQTGTILKNNILGALSGSADISGSGIKSKTLQAKASVMVDSLFFMGYKYTGTTFKGDIRPGEYSARININDPAITLAFDASLKAVESQFLLKTSGNFRANLFDLHILKDTLTTEGVISADLSKKTSELNASAILSAIKFTSPNEIAEIKKITASLTSDSLKTSIDSESDFFDVKGFIMKPTSDLADFLQSIKKHYNSIIDPRDTDSLQFYSALPALDFKIDLDYHKVLSLFIPETSLSYKTISIMANTGNAGHSLKYNVKGNGIKYGSFAVENLGLTLNDSSSMVAAELIANSITATSQKFAALHIISNFKEFESVTKISISDNQAKQIYIFDLKSESEGSKIFLKSPSQLLVLNGTKWTLDKPDLMEVNLTERTLSPSLMMHTESSFLNFVSTPGASGQSFNLDLKNVKLNSLLRAELLPGNPELTITGSAKYSKDKSSKTKINTDILINDVSWSDLNFDRISLKGQFESDSTGAYQIDMSSKLDSSEVSFKGNKPSRGNRTLNLKLAGIPIYTFQPFVDKYLSGLKGYLSGDLNVSSKNGVESFNGEFFLKDWNLRINALNSLYKMPDDRIRLSGKKVFFEKFKVLDSLNKELLVDGLIDFSDKKAITTDLEITSSNLQVMNKKEDKTASLYGDIFIDTQLSIKGPVTSPVLKGKVTLSQGTDIYFRQMENLNISESSKVLTFVSGTNQDEAGSAKRNEGLAIYNKTSVESVIVIDPDTRLNIKLEKKMFNIDLVIEGGGELNYNMLVNSQMNLSGKYEVSKGAADLKMIGWPNKAFTITKGGFIRWDGKVDDPELQFEALNRVRSSYTNPVDNKERYVDFDVRLKLANRLSDMDVQFSITTADQYLMSIINTLSPDEQMRQAITILLFEKIDLPGISTTSNYVTEQVNQMVASQLNALTKTTIKGIDISFGIDTYTQATQSGGQETKTSLSYEVKRSLMNDRAQIQLSGRMTDVTNQPSASSLSLNNVSFEYRLDSAATKFLKVYNEHTYEDVFEGEVIKTGIGVTYRKNYPTLRDIWRKEEKIGEPKKADK